MKYILPFLVILLSSFNLVSNNKEEQKTVISMQNEEGYQLKTFHTSAECQLCKQTIEEKLNYTKGVRFAELNIHTHELTVGYSSKKIDESKIKKIVSELGYDIDEVKANPKSQDALPKCCKPGGMNHN